MYNRELYHYGVKGMKWGVRRYQKKDGTLTEAGKERYSKSLDVNNMDRKRLLALIDSGKDFVIRKGQNFYRSTCSDNEVTEGKKYVSFRADDIGVYSRFVRETVATGNDKVYNDTYTSTKDVKVAGGRVQSEILQEMYGKNPKSSTPIDERFKKPISEMTDDEFGSYWYYNPFGHDMDVLDKPMSNPDTAEYIKRLRKRGYDAVVDMEDLSIGYGDGPMIILDSEKILKRTSHKLAD